MSLYYHGIEVEDAYYHGTKLDYIYYHGTMVYEATIYVPKPTMASGSFTFDNSAKSPTITGYDQAAMTQSGTTSATAAGSYSVTYTLKEGYAWADTSTNPVTLTWSIAKRTLTIPSLTNTTYTWAVNQTFRPTVNNFSSAYETQSGTASSTNTGTYTITWALRYPASTQWSDGTTANKSATWKVNKLSLTIPSISSAKSFTFIEGTTRSVTIANYSSGYETQSGTTSTSALGTYTITWALRYSANTQWSDGTTSNKTASWSIVWVNGQSHYSNDIYNRGWTSGKINFNSSYSFTMGADSIVVNSNGGAFDFMISDQISGTLHMEVYVTQGSANLACGTSATAKSGSSYASGTTGYTNTTGAWVEIYGAQKSGYTYMGAANIGATYNYSNGSQVRRIWIT